MPTEQRYAQIEMKLWQLSMPALSLTNIFMARKTKVESDHKPLESIFKKDSEIARAPTNDVTLSAEVRSQGNL